MAKTNLSREQYRRLHTMNKEALCAWLSVFAIQNYCDGNKDAFMSLLLKLHDEFGFGNEQIARLIDLTKDWLNACTSREEGIDSEGIRKQLISEGITCLEGYEV